MEIRKRFSDDVAILYLSGKVNIDSAEIIEETGSLAREGIGKILISFANVDIVDYHGLSILSIAYKNVLNQKGILKFCDVPPHIKGIFKAAGLDSIFDVYDDEEAALQGFETSGRVDKILMRRRFKRIEIANPVKYRPGLSDNAKLAQGKMLNLCGDGAFVHSKITYPASTHLYMEIYLEDSKGPVVLTGAVIWVAERDLQPHLYPGMGVKFVNMDSARQDMIVNYIDKNLTRRSRA